MQSIFGMEKRQIVKEFIQLVPSESEAFWRIYDEYESIRKDYGKERIVMLEKYAADYGSMTEEESKAWMKSVLSLRDRNEKLIATYYKKMLKECKPVTAMQFYQLESYILAGIRFQILESVPF